MIYLDYVSTTPFSEDLQAGYQDILKKYYANSESLHDLGREVDRLVEKSRHQLATLFHVSDQEIIFTSGASESNNMALKGVAWALKGKGGHVITSAYEHSSIMGASAQLRDLFGFDVTYLYPDENGMITLDNVISHLREDTVLVSLMYINNEIGSINPVYEIGAYLKKHSHAYFHVDAVQALGKYPIDLENIDMMSMSMHKIFGMKGSGILIKKQHVPMVPLISGGQQEYGLRGGTINFASDIIAARTVRLALENEKAHFAYVSRLYAWLKEQLSQIEGIVMNSPENGSVYILNFSCLKIPSEVMMNALNMHGFALSAQSTCHSKSKSISHVYQSMHYDTPRAESAVRIGLSHLVSEEELREFVCCLKGIIEEYGNL